MVPTAGIACVGLGIYSIFLAAVNYLTDAYEKYAALALSAASLGRNTFAAFLPLASYSLFQNFGYGWAATLLGFIGLALTVVPVVLILKGPEIRKGVLSCWRLYMMKMRDTKGIVLEHDDCAR